MKIFHWLFGSFFRTIGRTIALLLMGILLYYILSANGIGISDLFFDKVNALSWDVSSPDQHKIWDNEYFIQSADTSINKNAMFTYPYSSGNRDVQVFSFSGLTWVENGWSEDDSYHKFITGYSKFMRVTLITSSVWTQCEIQNNLIVCPVEKNVTVQGLKFKIDLPTTFADAWQETAINIYNWSNGYMMNSNQAIIDNQNQNTQDIINQQQNSTQQMLDDNTTQAVDEGSSFFSNFSSEDHGGLNSIITAPLNTIRSLLNATCTKLVLPLPFVNKNMELPCMNDIYTEHFGLFFTLYQTIVLALISYRCLRSIFFDITGFTNPDDDRIEVMDL